MKAKAMTVEKVIEEREKSELKDLKQQIRIVNHDNEECNNWNRKDKG